MQGHHLESTSKYPLKYFDVFDLIQVAAFQKDLYMFGIIDSLGEHFIQPALVNFG